MRIDPHAWLVTVPVTVALIQLYFQPADYVVKRWWREIARWESDTWGKLSLLAWTDSSPRSTLCYGLMVAAMAVCSVASFGSFLGLIS